MMATGTIAVLAGASRAAAADKTATTAIQVQNENESSRTSNRTTTFAHASRLGECNTFDFALGAPIAAVERRRQADVGILGCGSKGTCLPDESSALGGRCARGGKATRRTLQEETSDSSFGCPVGCPQEFCDCAEGDLGNGGGNVASCTAEMHSVCTQNQLLLCIPDQYVYFYEKAYCPFAACLVGGEQTYEECLCGYYGDYCATYYAFEQSTDKCLISDCCDMNPAESKFTCLPVLYQPSTAPSVTGAPTVTSRPTQNPSGSPSNTPLPSASPSASALPTPSPSASPTASPAPSADPTVPSPSRGPSAAPSFLEFIFDDGPAGAAPPEVSTAPSTDPTDPPLGSVSDPSGPPSNGLGASSLSGGVDPDSPVAEAEAEEDVFDWVDNAGGSARSAAFWAKWALFFAWIAMEMRGF